MFGFLQSRPGLDAFHQVLSEKGGRWYRACLRITGDAGLAEDAVQDALVKAWHRRSEFRGDSELDTWIHRIALNAAIDLVRRRKGPVEEDENPDRHAAPGHAAPDRQYESRALMGDISVSLERLTQREREAFLLKHLEGWSLEDIAAKQGGNVNNTKQALFRATRKLRADLEGWRG
jgi:RNA polymerase sigma-70 factor (ECF subfamily)